MKQICLSRVLRAKSRERERENQKRSADVQTLSKFSPKCDAQHVVRDPQRSFFFLFLAFSFLGFSASSSPSSFFSSFAPEKKKILRNSYNIKSRECERREKGRDLVGGIYLFFLFFFIRGAFENNTTDALFSLSSLLLLLLLLFFFAISSLLNCRERR